MSKWYMQIEPQMIAGKNVMIAAHGNSLRSIIMYLDKLTSKEVWLYYIWICQNEIFLNFSDQSYYGYRSLTWSCQLEFPCYTYIKMPSS